MVTPDVMTGGGFQPTEPVPAMTVTDAKERLFQLGWDLMDINRYEAIFGADSLIAAAEANQSPPGTQAQSQEPYVDYFTQGGVRYGVRADGSAVAIPGQAGATGGRGGRAAAAG